MTRSMKFWNFLAPFYAKQKIGNEEAYQRKLRETQELFHPDMTVLEFGCGTGSTAVMHATHVAQYTGIDYSAKMISFAQEKSAGIPNLSFAQSTFDDWAAPDASYDMILGLSILHLLPDHKAALAKAHRLLKPGGYLVTSTICMGDFAGPVKFILPVVSMLRLAPVVTPFTAQTLQADIVQAGFTHLDSWQPSATEAMFQLSQKPA